jgi:hypothetical protein
MFGPTWRFFWIFQYRLVEDSLRPDGDPATFRGQDGVGSYHGRSTIVEAQSLTRKIIGKGDR